MKTLVTLLLTLLVWPAWADFSPVLHCQLMPDQRVFLRGPWTIEDRHLFSSALRQSVTQRKIVYENERESHLIHEIAFEWADEFSKVDLSLIRSDYYASYKKLRLSLKRGASVNELTQFLGANLPARREPLKVVVPTKGFWDKFARTCAEALKL